VNDEGDAMKRRNFVTGLGTVVAAGATAQTLLRSSETSVVAAASDTLLGHRMRVNHTPVGTAQISQGAAGEALTLGYIDGSAEFLVQGSKRAEHTLRNLWALINMRATIGIQGYVPAASPAFQRIDLIVNFKLNEPPFAAPFYAWQHLDIPGQRRMTSSTLAFTTGVPGAAAISVQFQVKSPISGSVVTGKLDYPIGGAGLGHGIYALAGPSPSTGGAPDWGGVTWARRAGELARHDGGAIDFDYITLALLPALE
jgi:hypothetical protein